jgi:nifR3 family TIM-barrel protein
MSMTDPQLAAAQAVREVPIGPLRVPNRAFLAPMAGITDVPFRRLASTLGAGLVVSEMTASGKLAAGEARARLQAEVTGTGIHVVQLAGCEPGPMAEAARVAEQSGADVIDINMGCPAKKVTHGYSGSALMRDLDHALTLIEATVTAVAIPVTVKMRLGWDENSLNAPALAARAEEAGVQMITVHGRTRCQFYRGTADWRAIAAVKAVVSIPVVVNGDIADGVDADRALAESGADAVMIGRASMGQPWLMAQIGAYLESGKLPRAPSMAHQEALLVQLYEDMLYHHGVEIGSRHARKHLRASVDRLLDAAGGRVPAHAHQMRLNMLTSHDPAVVIRNVRALYAAAGERTAA